MKKNREVSLLDLYQDKNLPVIFTIYYIEQVRNLDKGQPCKKKYTEMEESVVYLTTDLFSDSASLFKLPIASKLIRI
jgi:hypothetical protein